MNLFTASNGIMFTRAGDGSWRWEAGYAPSLVTAALRELFRAERDDELGRWRDPFEPHYVCYPVDGGETVYVVDERNGTQNWLNRRVTAGDDGPHGAAFRFFEAHPERKPWEDAKPGEVWVLSLEGDEIPYLAQPSIASGVYFAHRSHGIKPDSTMITAARRIWPEDAS